MSENTVETWLERYRAEGASPDRLREFLSTVSADIPQAIAAQMYIAEVEQAEYDSQVSFAHAAQQPLVDQAAQHHAEQMAQSSRQARRAEVVAWAAIAMSLASLCLPLFRHKREASPAAVPAAGIASPTASEPSPVSNDDTTPAAAAAATAASPAAKDPVADLRERIAKLSSNPPEDTLYVGISYDVERSGSVLAPLQATIRGKQHTLNHQTKKTAYVLEFTLTAAYRDGEWTFKHLSGSILDMSDLSKLPIDQDEHSVSFASQLNFQLGLKSERW